MLELDLNELECVSGASAIDDRRVGRLQAILYFFTLIWDPIERVWRLRDPDVKPQLSQMGIP